MPKLKLKLNDATLNVAATTREEYEALPGLNYSSMKELCKSPAHYQAYLQAPKKDSKALRVGNMVHQRVLQPAEFAKLTKEPDIKRNTKEGKEQYAAFLASLSPGYILADPDEYEEAKTVGDKMQEVLDSKGITNVFTEVMLTASEEDVQLKCSIDLVWDSPEGIYLIDLKTTEDASKGWKYQVKSYKYYLQAYTYLRIFELSTGVRPKGFKFLAMEKSPPYAWGFYELGPIFMSYGAMDYYACLNAHRNCSALDIWPAYSTEFITLDEELKTV